MTRRPTIRCQYTDGTQCCPAPGTIRRFDDGEAILWAGDGPWAIDIPKMADELRTARRVLVVARAPGSVRREIQAWWSAEAKAARVAASPPAVAKTGRPRPTRCGRPGKSGAPCGQAAGWGTDTPGKGPCVYHGGPTRQGGAEARRLEEQAHTFVRISRKARTGPLTPRERLEGDVALLGLLAAHRRREKRR